MKVLGSLATEASKQSSCGSWGGGASIHIYIYVYILSYIYMCARIILCCMYMRRRLAMISIWDSVHDSSPSGSQWPLSEDISNIWVTDIGRLVWDSQHVRNRIHDVMILGRAPVWVPDRDPTCCVPPFRACWTPLGDSLGLLLRVSQPGDWVEVLPNQESLCGCCCFELGSELSLSWAPFHGFPSRFP